MRHDEVQTIRIKSSHPQSQGAFIEINADDFDPMVHEEYSEADDTAQIKRGGWPKGKPRKLAE